MAAPSITCNDQHRFKIAERFRRIGAEIASIFLEPVGRNTDPSNALAPLNAREGGKYPTLFVLVADDYRRGTKRQSGSYLERVNVSYFSTVTEGLDE